MIADTNSIIGSYLVRCVTLTSLIGGWAAPRLYCPRLPENAVLPALGFFTRGGSSTPYIPGIVTPSVQFDCWGNTPIEARQVYRALYDNLQGISMWDSIIYVLPPIGFFPPYPILSAIEEVQGQDLVDVEIPNYFRVLTFFSIMIRAV